MTFEFYFPLLMLRGHPTKLKCWHSCVPLFYLPKRNIEGEVTNLCKGIVEGIFKLLQTCCVNFQNPKKDDFRGCHFFARKINLGDFLTQKQQHQQQPTTQHRKTSMAVWVAQTATSLHFLKSGVVLPKFKNSIFQLFQILRFDSNLLD